jgi:hypothetical protein
MALVDIEQWRAERGFNGPGPSNAPPAPENFVTAGPDPQIEAMAQEIARQADLIRALQGALREYVDREERARLVAMNAARRPAMARVKRRLRKITVGVSPASSSPVAVTRFP